MKRKIWFYSICIFAIGTGFLLLFSGCGEKDEQDEQVMIPDENFLSALISWGVDNNGDGQISTEEAEAIDTLSVMDKSISDLTGIEAFVNLIELNCWINQLTSLDVSNNIDLQNLICSDNQLTTLDISNNYALVQLSISGMPALYKVCVWQVPFPLIELWAVNSYDSPNVYYTTDCGK